MAAKTQSLSLKTTVQDDTLDTVVGVAFTPAEDGFISVGVDKSLRIWLKRETGRYWPSVCHFLQSPCSTICFSTDKRVLFVGQDSGEIDEFEIAEDYNQVTQKRKYEAHQRSVSGIEFSPQSEIMVACGRDKNLTWHWTQSGQKLGGFVAASPLTCLQYDVASHYVFAGMTNSDIVVLKISKNNFQLVATLKGHDNEITCLCWDPLKETLYSGSSDGLIYAWDIGGKKGVKIQLLGHTQKMVNLQFAPKWSQLHSVSSDGTYIVWDTTAKRLEAPSWEDADHCTKCNQPFFWNFKQMWSSKTMGQRRHHCRKCGASVCITCASDMSVLPSHGFELEVRLCKDCFKSITDKDLVSTARFHKVQPNVVTVNSDWSRAWLACSGSDRTIKLWDLNSVLGK